MDYNIDDFVVMHNNKHKYYCEAIIRPNGQITYAEPSHLMKLQTIWGVPAEQLYDGGPVRDKLAAMMPRLASPVHWLAEVLNCVIVWYNAVIFPPNYTDSQMESIKKLIANGCISDHLSLEVTMEYQICDGDNPSVEQLRLIGRQKEQTLDTIKNELQM